MLVLGRLKAFSRALGKAPVTFFSSLSRNRCKGLQGGGQHLFGLFLVSCCHWEDVLLLKSLTQEGQSYMLKVVHAKVKPRLVWFADLSKEK